MMNNIAIITGGNSAEYEISIKSANVVKENLDKKKFNPIIVHVKENEWKAIINNAYFKIDRSDFSLQYKNKKIHFDIAFMALHGPPAENGELQRYFDRIGIPYTSSGEKQSLLTFNKNACNKRLLRLGFTCPKSIIYKNQDPIKTKYIINNIGLPCFVKPNSSGSSFGVSKVVKIEHLEEAVKLAFKYDKQILIEQYINGIEVSCGIFRTRKEIKVLPITEIVSHNAFFDYEAKYKGLSEEITPARINENLTHKVKNITKKVYQKLKLKGIVRIDYIIQKEIPYLIEINTIPGLSTESIIPKQAKESGYKLSDFFEMTIENTLK